jgi:uncharacterized protein (TIGR02145 family)
MKVALLVFPPVSATASYNGNYSGMGYFGYFWSSSEGSSNDAWYRVLNFSSSDVIRYGGSKQFGFSIRYLGD